jgi:hypothetical protein
MEHLNVAFSNTGGGGLIILRGELVGPSKQNGFIRPPLPSPPFFPQPNPHWVGNPIRELANRALVPSVKG